jgi:hypothetical protein
VPPPKSVALHVGRVKEKQPPLPRRALHPHSAAEVLELADLGEEMHQGIDVLDHSIMTWNKWTSGSVRIRSEQSTADCGPEPDGAGVEDHLQKFQWAHERR